MKIWSRAPREPYQSKSEPFQIEVKPGVLDQKIMQNSKPMMLDSENMVQSSQGARSDESRAILDWSKIWHTWSVKEAKYKNHQPRVALVGWGVDLRLRKYHEIWSLFNKQCYCRRTSKETETDYSIFRTQVPHRYFPYILLQKMSPDTRLPSVFWKWFKEHDAASWHWLTLGWWYDNKSWRWMTLCTINVYVISLYHDGEWWCVREMYTIPHFIMERHTLSWLDDGDDHMYTVNVYGTTLYHDDVYDQCIRYLTISWRCIRSVYTVPH